MRKLGLKRLADGASACNTRSVCCICAHRIDSVVYSGLNATAIKAQCENGCAPPDHIATCPNGRMRQPARISGSRAKSICKWMQWKCEYEIGLIPGPRVHKIKLREQGASPSCIAHRPFVAATSAGVCSQRPVTRSDEHEWMDST
eukprot:scaffold184335_cov30-Tisochrysis_lutea.AAC.1